MNLKLNFRDQAPSFCEEWGPRGSFVRSVPLDPSELEQETAVPPTPTPDPEQRDSRGLVRCAFNL